MKFLVVSQVARELGVKPRDISDLFYARKLDDERCPVVAGRRLIRATYLPKIAEALRENGRLQPAEVAQ